MAPVRRIVKEVTKLSDLAYTRIKRDVVDCALRPGSAVTEMQLSKRYKLGKAPVRAALERLRQEGLVQSVPRRGYSICPIIVKDVRDLFEFRMLIEPATARLAADRITPAIIRELKLLCGGDRMTDTAFNRTNTNFHVAIARAAGNQRVVVALEHLLSIMERLFHMDIPNLDKGKAVEDHRALIKALAARDGQRAQELAAAHIEVARTRIMAAIFASPDLMDVEIGYQSRAPFGAPARRLASIAGSR